MTMTIAPAEKGEREPLILTEADVENLIGATSYLESMVDEKIEAVTPNGAADYYMAVFVYAAENSPVGYVLRRVMTKAGEHYLGAGYDADIMRMFQESEGYNTVGTAKESDKLLARLESAMTRDEASKGEGGWQVLHDFVTTLQAVKMLGLTEYTAFLGYLHSVRDSTPNVHEDYLKKRATEMYLAAVAEYEKSRTASMSASL